MILVILDQAPELFDISVFVKIILFDKLHQLGTLYTMIHENLVINLVNLNQSAHLEDLCFVVSRRLKFRFKLLVGLELHFELGDVNPFRFLF